MDSPFSGATIEGRNFNEMEKGSTITLTCRVMEMEVEGNESRKGANTRHIEWLKDGEPVNIKVNSEAFRELFFCSIFSAFLVFTRFHIFLICLLTMKCNFN